MIDRAPQRFARRVLALVLCACVAGAARSTSAPGAPAWTDGERLVLGADLELTRLLPSDTLPSRVYLHRSSSEVGGRPMWANGLVVVEDDDALLLDTPWTDDQTARLLDVLAREVGARVRCAFVTHAHPDAAGGVGELHARGIAVLGSEATLAFARSLGVPGPDVTFADEATLVLGDTRVRLFAAGDGHAPGNAAASIEPGALVFGGCMVKDVSARDLGFTGDADLAHWPACLDALATRWPLDDATWLVPGHGEPGPALRLLRHTRELLDTRARREASAADGTAPTPAPDDRERR
ncbi:MAG: MBL fold metallo-hydrolase [Planctomycetes bacterium]|nr:MBL fold metallo-hydrolase [Planctomycetota bacterium]